MIVLNLMSARERREERERRREKERERERERGRDRRALQYIVLRRQKNPRENGKK